MGKFSWCIHEPKNQYIYNSRVSSSMVERSFGGQEDDATNKGPRRTNPDER